MGLLEEGEFGELDHEGRKLVHLVRNESERLVDLTTRLLDMAKLEARNLTLNLQACDIRRLMERSREAASLQAHEKGIKLRIEQTDSDVHNARVDPERIVQLLVNYLTNAIKYSESGTEVVMKARAEEEFLQIEVCDQGRGIPPDRLEDIFKRFQQVESEDSHKASGLVWRFAN